MGPNGNRIMGAAGYAVLGGGYAQDAACAQSDAKRENEIPHQIECLERALKGCFQGLDTLGGRLESSVMRGEPQQPVAGDGCGNGTLGGPQTPTGARLAALVDTAALLNERILSMVYRLEV